VDRLEPYPAGAGVAALKDHSLSDVLPVAHVYLSPHLDDAVLSCGATIARQVASGVAVEVLTLFAGQPQLDTLSTYARQLHVASGDSPDMVGTRREEDAAACRLLAAGFLHLDYLDAPYRRDPDSGTPLYTSDAELLGWHPHPADQGLVAELVGTIASRYEGGPALRMYAPLGAGGHVDHLAVRAAALELQRCGFGLAFYEDYPHVQDGHGLVRALALPHAGGWVAELSELQDSHVLAKCKAIACHESQIPVLFGDGEEMIRSVRSYMDLTGGSAGYAERFWKSVSASDGQGLR